MYFDVQATCPNCAEQTISAEAKIVTMTAHPEVSLGVLHHDCTCWIYCDTDVGFKWYQSRCRDRLRAEAAYEFNEYVDAYSHVGD